MKTPVLASAITLLSCALSSTAHAEVLAATHADFSTAAQGANGLYYGYYQGTNSTAGAFSIAAMVANGANWNGNQPFGTPLHGYRSLHPGGSTRSAVVRRYTVGAGGESAFSGEVRIVGRFFDVDIGAVNAFVVLDPDGDAGAGARNFLVPPTAVNGALASVPFDLTATVSPNATIDFGALSGASANEDSIGFYASIVTGDTAVPTQIVASNYASVLDFVVSATDLRSNAAAMATDGVVSATDAGTFDTTPGTAAHPYQFAGLLYLENAGSGKATRFDSVRIDLTTVGDFSDTPRLYVLRHNSDPASSNPALDDRYVRMPIVPVRLAANSAGQPAYTFDLTSLSPAERSGYGFAVVGAGMYQGTSISVSELSATAVRVSDTAVITPQPFLVAGPNGHRYGLSVVRGDWEQSEASAVAAGGHLVTINDAVENAFLVPQFGGTERFYIGLKQDGPDATTEPGGGWRWRTGELLSAPGAYLNWHSTQPNGSEGPEEDFGFMNEWQPSGTWGDAVVGGYPPTLRNTFRGIIELDTAGSGPKAYFVPEISAKANIFDAGLASPTQGGSLPPSIDVTHANQQFVVFPQIVGVIDTTADKHGPDGKHTAGRSCDITSVGGISGYLNGNNTPALVGVFLGPTLPVSAPPRLDFSTGAVGEDFTTLAPALGQVFFIGDGFTSAGIAQKFTVPAGATRLYFGVPDGNSGPTNDNATLYHGTPRAYVDNVGSVSLRATITPGPIPTIIDAFFPLRGGQLTLLGGTGTSTVAVQSGALPTGLSISTSGLVTGVPTDGPYSFTLRVTDSLGEQSDRVFSGDIGSIVSTFDSNVDGWTASGDPTGPPQFSATGGNPAGRIHVTDGSQGSYLGFDAPPKFLGNQSEKYGGTLHFDLMQSYSGAENPANEPDVTLVSGLLTLVFDTSPNPANNAWTSYSVPLTETAGWKVGSLTGPAPTQAQMQSVLGNLSILRIRAEFQNGPDTDSLDNARLVAAPAPADIAVEQPTGNPLTGGGTTIHFGTASVGAPVEKTFTIKNTGGSNLELLTATTDGDFAAGSFGMTTLLANQSTTLTVTFNPTASGLRTGALHITSTDADESPFDIVLTGSGYLVGGTDVISIFDSDSQGWTASGNTSSSVQFSATGGQPGGHVFLADGVTAGVTYFKAPASFLGNQAGFYGGVLSFDLMQSYAGVADQFDDSDIILVGAGLTLVYDTSPNPAKDAWTSYSISLTETAGWKINTLGGTAPTQAQMQSVLGSLTSLRIRTEFQTGQDTGSLDNPRLTATLAPEITVEQPAGTGLADGAGAVNFGTSELLAPVTRTFTITNTGTAQLTLTPPVPSGDFIPGVIGDATLDPAQSTTFTVTFTPSAAGVRTGVLQITSNDADESPFDIALTGTGFNAVGNAIFAWGEGGFSVIGDGTTIDRFTAVPTIMTGALANKVVTAVEAGTTHNFAITSDGDLFAWGTNDYGQLGDGSTITRSAPVAVDMSNISGEVIACAAIGTLSVALTNEGKVYTWGANYFGQLGLGTTTARSTPQLVQGLLVGKNVVAISAGGFCVMVLTSEGEVFGWGLNLAGTLCDGTTTDRSSPVALVKTGTLLQGKTISTILCSFHHTLALDSDGKLYSWGFNGNGELGDGTTTDRLLPVAVNGALTGKTVTAISGNRFGPHLALTSDGLLYGWGANFAGAIGDGTTTDRHAPVAVDMSGALLGKEIVSIHADGFSMVRTADNKLFTWGENSKGQLGVGPNLLRSHTPVAVDMTGVLAGRTLVASSIGDASHALVIAYAPPAPEITVKRSDNSELTDGASILDLGTSLPAGSTNLTITIKNDGNALLSGLDITRSGTHETEFVMGPLGSTTLAPGATTTFTVTFTPAASGAREAALHIASDDANEDPFDITLIGTGGIPITDWRETHFSTTANAGEAADHADFDRDGDSNLLEFATNADPTESSVTETPVSTPAGGFITFIYTRNKQAMAELTYQVQWTDDLLTAWSSVGVTETIISDNGLVQQVSAIVPTGGNDHRFVQLKVTR